MSKEKIEAPERIWVHDPEKKGCKDFEYIRVDKYSELEKKYEKRDLEARRFIDQLVKIKQEKDDYKHCYESGKYQIAALENKLEIAVEDISKKQKEAKIRLDIGIDRLREKEENNQDLRNSQENVAWIEGKIKAFEISLKTISKITGDKDD